METDKRLLKLLTPPLSNQCSHEVQIGSKDLQTTIRFCEVSGIVILKDLKSRCINRKWLVVNRPRCHRHENPPFCNFTRTLYLLFRKKAKIR